MADDSDDEDDAPEAEEEAEDEDIADSQSGSRPLLRIFWGSQTGTAQRFASKLAKEAKKHGFRGKSIDLEGWNTSHFLQLEDGSKATPMSGAGSGSATTAPISLFLMATYGEGDPTANAESFMEWLEDTEPEAVGSLNGLPYGVFGLGNKTYDHYNAVGKITNAGLKARGASPVVPYGEGDDDDNINEDFAQWRQQLWPALRVAAGLGDESEGGKKGSAVGGIAGGDDDGLPEEADLAFQVRFVPEPDSVCRKGPAFAAAARRDPSLIHGFTSVREEEALQSPGPGWQRPAGAAAGVGGEDKHAGKSYGKSKAVPASLVSQGELASMEAEPYFTAVPVRVIANRELRYKPEPDASTFHVELDLKGSGLTYETADNLSVLPRNDDKDVESLCRWLGGEFEKPDEWFVLDPKQGESAGDGDDDDDDAPEPLLPTPTTVRAALSWFVDLQATPSREFVGQLARYATKPEDRAKMAFYSRNEGRGEWQEWAVLGHRSLIEVLQEFSSVRPPLAAFLELAPRLKPRQYTIASSSVAHPRRIHLAVSILREPKPGPDPQREHRGVCTHYMQGVLPPMTEDGIVVGPAGGQAAAAPSGSAAGVGPWPTMRVFVTTSHFELPQDPSKPVVLVGPGTGIAPMRAFLQERAVQRERLGADAVGPTVLFFGCRREEEDFIYRDEIEGWRADGILSELVLAFSRQVVGKKTYVQDRLLEPEWRGKVWDMIHGQGGSLYVCGAKRMGQSVVQALGAIAKDVGHLEEADARQYIDRLEKTHRLVQELW